MCLGTTINLQQTVYRNLDRDRRKVNPAIVQERPDEKLSRLEAVVENNRQLEEMQTEAKEKDKLVNEVVKLLTPWGGEYSDVHDELVRRGVVGGEFSVLHKTILNRLQQQPHSGVVS